jgi:hypothetical protein
MAAPSDFVAIGSFALMHWAPGELRAPADVDLVATSAAATSWVEALRTSGLLAAHSYSHNGTKLHVKLAAPSSLPIEVELVHPGEGSSSADLLARSGPWPRVVVPHAGGITAAAAPLPALMAVKQSHLFFAVHWHKHMADFHVLKRLCAAQAHAPAIAEWAPFVATRRAEAQARYGESKVTSLDIPNDAFFKVWYLKEMVPDSVREAALVAGCEVYTHDELHELLAYVPNQPVYASLKVDPAKAALNRGLFEASPHQTKLRLVREEVHGPPRLHPLTEICPF